MQNQDKYNKYLDSVLGVNASWREQWNEFGCLAAFEYDFNLGGDVFSDALMEEFGISQDEASDAIQNHVIQNNFTFSLDVIKDNLNFVLETLNNNGGDGRQDLLDLEDPEITAWIEDHTDTDQ